MAITHVAITHVAITHVAITHVAITHVAITHVAILHLTVSCDALQMIVMGVMMMRRRESGLCMLVMTRKRQ